jgi:hypothetical protein
MAAGMRVALDRLMRIHVTCELNFFATVVFDN